jgi:hypothetical protein
MGDGDPQLTFVADLGGIVDEVDHRYRGARRACVVAIRCCRTHRCGVGLGALVGFVDHTGQRGGVCAVLDLKTLPVQPAKVDRHCGGPQQIDQHHCHER